MCVFDEDSTKWLPITYSGASHPKVGNAATWYDPATHTMYSFGGQDHLRKNQDFHLFSELTKLTENYNRDMWTFNPTTFVWTKLNGDATSQGSYGTRGVFSPTNHPGARASAGCVIESSGFLWLFGGKGLGSQDIIGKLT